LIQVLRLRRIAATNPQHYSIVWKDPLKSTETKFGTEADIRKLLLKNGVARSEIDDLFERTKSSSYWPCFMKGLVPIPPESADQLKREKLKGWSYQFVYVKLKDGRRFGPAVVSEGCIIQIKPRKDWMRNLDYNECGPL
jgi:hypothetical protein